MAPNETSLMDAIELNGVKQSQALDAAAEIATRDEHSLNFWQAVRRFPTATFWAIALSFTIIMEGYDTILISNFYAYPQFKKKYGTYYPGLDEWLIPTSWQVALSLAPTSGSVIGLIINGFVTERFGHRKVIMASLSVLCAFIFIPFFAPNLPVLLLGLILCSIPWGVFGILGSAYASEICPLALRGVLTSFINICWVIGQLVAAGVLQGLINNPTEWAFRIPLALQWMWPVPLFVLAFMAPDSPWWLIRKNRIAEAKDVLTRLSSQDTSSEEIETKLAMMVHTNNLEAATKTESTYSDCFQGTNLRRTEIACMVLMAQTLSGEQFAYGSTYFFTQAGLSSSDSYKLNFIGFAVAFVATCCSWILMRWFGRRSMIIGGMTLMTITLLIIGALSYPAATSNTDTWTQAILTLVWLAIYSITLGPQSFALAAEISATRVRSQTLSLARNAYICMNLITGLIEPYLINPTAANLKGKTAFVWMGIATLSIIWCIFRLPETKGRTYEELDILFEKGTPAWKFKSADIDLIRDASEISGQEKVEHEHA
ncbi:general substrate transporter [Penicillium lagena]|uniref:general substrate transporter n=1 Tax=Penicillium lagena TaxID=94218 RepID=UPI002540A0DC|nr:general substrate transporter [Penicillium lagena]KAJ5620937.1 general substrate transporter [Penicillium lagena]